MNQNEEKQIEQTDEKPTNDNWLENMKDDLEDYIEEQGVYLRQ